MKARHTLALLPLALGLTDSALRPSKASDRGAATALIEAPRTIRESGPRTRTAGSAGIHYINVGQAAAAVVDLKNIAILIDAGGETTENDEYADHLIDYLNRFFQDRPQLGNTLAAVIISHPHIDHTKNLMAVMQAFKVENLIDGGDDEGSGIAQLRKAREFARQNGIRHMAVSNRSVGREGKSVKSTLGINGEADVVLLSGSRDCDNQNNNSLSVRITTPEASILFTGDSEEEGDQSCDSGMLAFLEGRFGNNLHADVYHAAHHGSFNGTTDEFMKLVTPKISVISAGNPATKSPGAFHAFQFGHPREVAVNQLIQNTTLGRDRKNVVIFPKIKTPKSVDINKAVYCTCWDGDIVVNYTAGNTKPAIETSGFHITP